MASAARDRLAKTLRSDSEPASRTKRTVRMDALTLDVEGFGRADDAGSARSVGKRADPAAAQLPGDRRGRPLSLGAARA
jgi:hypothetical protein